MKTLFALVFAIIVWSALAAPMKAATPVGALPFTSDDLRMERHKIRDTDDRIWLSNGRHRIHAARCSTTAFFMPGYKFRFDFVEKRSGTRIKDNINEDPGDPLGYNFRPGAPYCIVAQDDAWYPHQQVRTGTFHKELKSALTSFAIKTETLVALPPARACVAVTLTNRDTEPLTLTLLPVQNDKNLIRLPIGNRLVCVSSDLTESKGEGFVWTLLPNATETRYFVITDCDADKAPPATGNREVAAVAAQSEKDGQEQIRRITSRIPAIKTQSRQLDDMYKRCIASLALCRWEGAQFRNQPTWVVGGAFICVTAWDFSFATDTMMLVDPIALRNVVRDVLGIGQMKGSYISVRELKNEHGILYLQDPFALQELVRRYIIITGDRTILDDRVGDASVYEWLKSWGDKLHDEFGKGPGGLIDVGDNEQLLIEIRTGDYTGIVPVVNGLTVDYYRWLAELASGRKDPDAAKFARYGEELQKAFHGELWNEKNGWFDCMVRGKRKSVMSYHLYDLLGTSAITGQQQRAMESHLKEGEFLAEYGMYSISRKDTVHWDRMDADFGGGGSYVGMPFRIARRLYEHGNPQTGWEIMKRMARLADHFSLMPHSPQAEEPYEFRTGGNMNISCVSGMEAIWSGIFGLRPQEDGSMIITPAPYNPEVGEADLAGYPFRKHRYDVRLGKTGYEVLVDGKPRGRESYGKSFTIPALPP